jgi:hypothetical protein
MAHDRIRNRTYILFGTTLVVTAVVVTACFFDMAHEMKVLSYDVRQKVSPIALITGTALLVLMTIRLVHFEILRRTELPGFIRLHSERGIAGTIVHIDEGVLSGRGRQPDGGDRIPLPCPVKRGLQVPLGGRCGRNRQTGWIPLCRCPGSGLMRMTLCELVRIGHSLPDFSGAIRAGLPVS